MGRLVLTSKGLLWFQRGHPWIFRDDLDRIEGAAPGDIVSLERKNGTFLAQGFYSDQSKIAFRLITRSNEFIGPIFWKNRIQRAFQYRQTRVAKTNAYRIVYGESDGIPSLIVDRYGSHFSIQTLSQGVERRLTLFAEILQELFSPSTLTARNDLAIREREGLPREKRMIWGDPCINVETFEEDFSYITDLWNGQKTGAYLDQRENRQLAASLLQGKVLDAFSYQGWFAIQVARRASQVIALDSSQEALVRARENARRNGLKNLEFLRENAFHFLNEESRRGEAYDGIILDPPSFAKSKENLPGAVRGYQDLNRRALALLKPGGILVTASCSYHFTEENFMEVLKNCTRGAEFTLRILAKRSQSADHPILLSFPESSYLKCFFLQKIAL